MSIDNNETDQRRAIVTVCGGIAEVVRGDVLIIDLDVSDVADAGDLIEIQRSMGEAVLADAPSSVLTALREQYATAEANARGSA